MKSKVSSSSYTLELADCHANSIKIDTTDADFSKIELLEMVWRENIDKYGGQIFGLSGEKGSVVEDKLVHIARKMKCYEYFIMSLIPKNSNGYHYPLFRDASNNIKAHTIRIFRKLMLPLYVKRKTVKDKDLFDLLFTLSKGLSSGWTTPQETIVRYYCMLFQHILKPAGLDSTAECLIDRVKFDLHVPTHPDESGSGKKVCLDDFRKARLPVVKRRGSMSESDVDQQVRKDIRKIFPPAPTLEELANSPNDTFDQYEEEFAKFLNDTSKDYMCPNEIEHFPENPKLTSEVQYAYDLYLAFKRLVPYTNQILAPPSLEAEVPKSDVPFDFCAAVFPGYSSAQ